MGLSRSTYYYRIKADEKAKVRDAADTEVKDLIDQVHTDFPTYGYRKLHRELLRRGHLFNEKKLRRIQKKFGLFPVRIRAFVRTTDSKHGFRIYPNLVKENSKPMRPNQIWVADLTHIRIWTGFVYLAVILDLFSRRVVGWAISKKIDRALALGALRMAINNRDPGPGCIHHSDRGVQYASSDYVDLLRSRGFLISMSDKANPYDNAWAESFMRILKYEEVYLAEYETYEDVVRRIPHFIEEVYNQKRIHSSINYLTPVEFEWEFMKNNEASSHPKA